MTRYFLSQNVAFNHIALLEFWEIRFCFKLEALHSSATQGVLFIHPDGRHFSSLKARALPQPTKILVEDSSLSLVRIHRGVATEGTRCPLTFALSADLQYVNCAGRCCIADKTRGKSSLSAHLGCPPLQQIFLASPLRIGLYSIAYNI